ARAAGQAHPRLLPGTRRLRPGARGLRLRWRRGEAGGDPVRHRPEGQQQPGAPLGDPADPGGEAGSPGVPEDPLIAERERTPVLRPVPVGPGSAGPALPPVGGGGGLGGRREVRNRWGGREVPKQMGWEGGPEKMTAEARWFGRAVWLGILADWVLAVPTI